MLDGGQWTYTSLTEAVHHRTIILRVHTTPHNPLEQGFTARNPAFNRLTVEQYHHATSSLGGRWAEGPYMRDVIIDHINQLVRRPQPPPLLHGGHGTRFRLGPHSFPLSGPRMKAETDDLSPWISTTANLDWAIWYIAKLLSQMTHHGVRYRYDQVKLSVISISTDRTLNKELYVAPFLWSSPCNSRRISDVDRERYNRARKSAILAKEVLFYGRIFKDSILADLTFTRENLPFALPSVYYNPPEMHNPTFASSWIGRLRWDPRLLNYEMAQYNRMKMMGPRCFWEGQPVDSRLQSFKRDVVQNQRGDTKRVETFIRPPPSGRKEEKKVEVLEGQLVGP